MIAGLAFKYFENLPTKFRQACADLSVARDITRQFGQPIVEPSLWQACVTTAFVPVPKAAMDHNYFSEAGEYEVRRARQIPTV